MQQKKTPNNSIDGASSHWDEKPGFYFLGCLRDSALEKEFRVYHLSKDIQTCVTICLIIVGIEASLVLMDLVTEGTTAITSPGPNFIRMLWVFLGSLLAVFMWNTKSSKVLDWFTYGTIAAGTILMLYVNHRFNTTILAYSGLPLLFLISFYVFSPAPLSYKTLIAIGYTASIIYVTLVIHDFEGITSGTHFVGTFVGGNILGCIGSRAIAISERKQFLRWREENNLRMELESALTHIRELSGLLPICASCKSVRDDTDYWHSIEAYIAQHTDIDFSHTICPNCQEVLYADMKHDSSAKVDTPIE